MSPAIQNVITNHTSAEVVDQLRRWGFVHGTTGKEHKTLRLPSTGKVISVRKRRTAKINQYTINEALNILAVDEPTFWRGPIEQPVKVKIASKKAPVLVPEPAPPPTPTAPPEVPQPKVSNTTPRRQVIEFLHAVGGKVEDAQGRALILMAEAMDITQGTLAQLLRKMEKDAQVLKDNLNPATKRTVAKRTYGVHLLYDGPNVASVLGVPPTGPKEPLEAPPAATTETKAEPASAALAALPGMEASEPVGEGSPTSLVQPEAQPLDYERLADAVVNNLVRRLTTLDRERALRAEIAELRGRLNRTVEYGQRLRRERAGLEEKALALETRLNGKGHGP
jgi:hypothetical protein